MQKIRFASKLSNYAWLKPMYLMLLSGLLSLQQVNAQTPITVIKGNISGPGTWSFGPIYRNTTNAGLLNYSRYAYLYTAAELGIPAGSKIVKLEWLKRSGGTIAPNNVFNVWVGNTTATSFPSTEQWGNLVAGTTQTYASTTYSILGGDNTWIDATFNIPGSDTITYTGDALKILTDWQKIGTQTGSGIAFYNLTASNMALGVPSAAPLNATSLLQNAVYGTQRPTIRITYIPVPPCSGIPVTGGVVASVATACENVPFSLSIANTLSGTGISYLWQKASDAAFTSGVVPISTSSTAVASQTASSYYRCIATCSTGNTKDTTAPFFIPMSPHYDCYCSSSAVSPADEEIINFTFGSLNNSSNCSTLAPGVNSVAQLYSNYKGFTDTPKVERESLVPFSIQIGTCLNVYGNVSAIFIDYNHNFTFELSERVYSSSVVTAGAHFESGNIEIPANAMLGLTGLRVITKETSQFIDNACGTYSFGETEDYLIEITPKTFCLGTPNPGNTVSSASDVCSGGNANLTLQTLTVGFGVTYQWYMNNMPISGATAANYTALGITSPTTYYCAVTCGGNTGNSNPVNIGIKNFLDCYCSSVAGAIDDEEIFEVILDGRAYGYDCNTVAPGPGSILNRYSNYHPLGSIDTFEIGKVINFSIEGDDCDQAPYYSFGTAIWVDYNQNGSFTDPGERVFAEPSVMNGPRFIIDSFKIDCKRARPGVTGMRIMVAEGLGGSLLQPCINYGFGETEDYKIMLKYPDTCSLASNPPGNTRGTVQVFCDSAISVLSIAQDCAFGNFTYQWCRNGVDIPGATDRTYTTPMLTDPITTFYCKVYCGSAIDSSLAINIFKAVRTPQVVSINPNYCVGDTTGVRIDASIQPTGGINYPVNFTYTPSSDLTPGSANNSIMFAKPNATTTYQVNAEVFLPPTGSAACIGTSSITINAANLPVNLTASSSTTCTPSAPILLTATDINGASYAYSSSPGGSLAGSTYTLNVSPTTSTTYSVVATSPSGCYGESSTSIAVTPCFITANVKLFIQGYYAGASTMRPALLNQGVGTSNTVTDSITIALYDETTFAFVAEQKVLLNTDGTTSANFPGVASGAYYIVIKHRNALLTWSAAAVSINGTLYNFTDAASKAYGANQIEMETGVFAIYSGDIVSDDNLDLLDVGFLESGVDAFLSGYQSTDLDGDGNVDLLDVPILETNVNNFIFAAHP